jgi:Mg2+ and Co2+ transporter CorA
MEERYLQDKPVTLWQPGEYLVPARNEPSQQDIQSLLSQMQSAISTQIQKVQMSLDTLSGQVDHLEDRYSRAIKVLPSFTFQQLIN